MIKNGNEIALKSIRWQAVLDGELLSYTSVQHYKNTTNNTVEINYSFPLPYGKSVITKFAAEINGVRREAKALPKREAEEKYEDAMEEGDSPIMLSLTEKDFCTASLGNLKKGETATIEIQYLQLVESSNSTTRVKIPVVLDSRYASNSEYPNDAFGLEPNVFADYDCTGSLLIKNAANASVQSPTHQIKVSQVAEGLMVEVVKGKADRDVVIDVECETKGHLYLAKDEDQWAALASFIPQIKPVEKQDALDLTILLDCSGSMFPTRIEWAKEALRRIVKGFTKQDKVSFFCFGSDCELKKLPSSVQWEGLDSNSRKRLHAPWNEVIDSIEAHGGTELAAAIHMCSDSFPGKTDKSAILLITDGEVWNKEQVLEAVKDSGRRVFVLGIGMAPYGNLLSEVATISGGCYNSVYSVFDVETEAVHVLNRLRSPVILNPKILWPSDALWVSKSPVAIFSSDSYIGAANLTDEIDALELSYSLGKENERLTIHRIPEDFGQPLCQLVANLRMISSSTKREQETLGLRYNLAGPATNFLLVVERQENEKVDDFAKLHIVPQMPVADRSYDSSLRRNNIMFMRQAPMERKFSRAMPPLFASRIGPIDPPAFSKCAVMRITPPKQSDENVTLGTIFGSFEGGVSLIMLALSSEIDRLRESLVDNVKAAKDAWNKSQSDAERRKTFAEIGFAMEAEDSESFTTLLCTGFEDYRKIQKAPNWVQLSKKLQKAFSIDLTFEEYLIEVEKQFPGLIKQVNKAAARAGADLGDVLKHVYLNGWFNAA